jgi:hypothetical protein
MCHEDLWGNGGIVSCILNTGIRWRWVVSFMPWLLYPWYPWIGGCAGPRAALDVKAKRKKSLPVLGIKPGHPACSLVTKLTELPQLLLWFISCRGHQVSWLRFTVIFLSHSRWRLSQNLEIGHVIFLPCPLQFTIVVISFHSLTDNLKVQQCK